MNATPAAPMPEPSAPGGSTLSQPPADPRLAGVARRLRDARRVKGMTQAEVAEALGVNRRAVYQWENAQSLPHLHLPGLAALYGRSAAWLLDGTESVTEEVAQLRDEVADLRALVLGLIEMTEAGFHAVRQLAGRAD